MPVNLRAIFSQERLPVLATLGVALLLYIVAGTQFQGFFAARVFFNFLSDNAYLGIIAVGLTFVILSGGIDLSVGSVVGCAGIMLAVMIQKLHWHPILGCLAVLTFGLMLGAGQGYLIQAYRLPPFLVTLVGLFLCRGIGLWISKESVQISHPWFTALTRFKVSVGWGASLPLVSLIFLAILVAGIFVARQTRFGRTVYAIGGSEGSALLMGLPVARTQVTIYALSGLCAALAGIVYALYTSSGNAISGTGMELDAIAAVVIGGTLLSGGYGSVFGSFLGVLILGMIQTAITFQGTLSSWWTKIFIGVLLLVFVLLQKGIQRSLGK